MTPKIFKPKIIIICGPTALGKTATAIGLAETFNGEIVGAVRNPGYRGISSTFWRSLTGVADRNSFTVMGTPNCGKGELNQEIGTGHASPACKFSNIEVFGGEQ